MIPVAFSVFVSYMLLVCGAMANHELADTVPSAPDDWLHSFYLLPPSFVAAFREALFGAYFDFQFTTSFNAVLWTMEVEFKGSLLVFATLALLGASVNRWVVYLALMLVLDGIQMPYFVDFVAGMVLCDWYSQRRRLSGSYKWLVAFGLGMCLADLNVEWLNGMGLSGLTRGHRFWPTIAAVLLIAATVQSDILKRALSVRPLVHLGRLSFSLYLLHLPIICSLGALIYCHMRHVNFSHTSSALTTSIACVVASLLAAHIGPLLLDPAALRMGRLFDSWMFRRPSGPLSTQVLSR